MVGGSLVAEKIYDTKVIAGLLRTALKEKYPSYKFSVTKKGNTISVALMSAPFNPFIDTDDANDGYVTLNPYYLSDSKTITAKAIEVMKFAKDTSDTWNWDKSDSMTDYFDVNFYFQVSIGKWDKPFVQSDPKKPLPAPSKPSTPKPKLPRPLEQGTIEWKVKKLTQWMFGESNDITGEDWERQRSSGELTNWPSKIDYVNTFAKAYKTPSKNKYIYIDIADRKGSAVSGKYMIDKADGVIYKIKGYGKRGNRTPWTVDEILDHLSLFTVDTLGALVQRKRKPILQLPPQPSYPLPAPKPNNESAINAINEEIADIYTALSIDTDFGKNSELKNLENDLQMLKKMLQSEQFNVDEGLEKYFNSIISPLDERYSSRISRRNAPNGGPSDLTSSNYNLVRSPQFKDWFGDWENWMPGVDYSGASAVMNERTREPLLVYHGTANPYAFSRFKFDRFPVMYFAANKEYAKWFADQGNGIMYENFLDIKKLADFRDFETNEVNWYYLRDYMISSLGINLPESHPNIPVNKSLKFWQWLRYDTPELTLINAIRAAGYTGIAHIEDNPSDLDDGKPRETEAFMIFSPEQAKEASMMNYDIEGFNSVMILGKGGDVKKGSDIMERIGGLE